MSLGNVTADDQKAINTELASGEVVLWSGSARFNSTVRLDPAFVVLGFLIAALATFAIYLYSPTHSVTVRELLAFFLFVLLAMAFGGYIVSKNTIYAVTNFRALIVRHVGSRSVQSFFKSNIRGVERTELPDGTGTILFSQDRATFGPFGRSRRFGFFGTTDVRGAEEALRCLIDSQSAAPTGAGRGHKLHFNAIEDQIDDDDKSSI